MTECIAYNEYAELKYNTIITMKICPSVQTVQGLEVSTYQSKYGRSGQHWYWAPCKLPLRWNIWQLETCWYLWTH